MANSIDNNVANNKRIAKNTLMLYMRMLLIMAVTLYTSRVVLAVLGVEDFGVYNVTGGIATSFVFFSSSLSNATQRYLNFELGKKNLSGANDIFNISILIYVVIALMVVVVAISIGPWLLNDVLVIPDSRLDAAYWVFYAMVFVLVITLVGSVYDSVLIARENMSVYAYVSVFEAIAKLLIVFVLAYADFDKLKLYAVLLLLVCIVIKSITAFICIRKYPECSFRYYWSKKLFRQMFAFIGWNGISTAVWMINEQGLNVLLNIFFGPIVNAARGIAMQVNSAVNNFSSSFYTAVRPQIVKSYASNDLTHFTRLVLSSSRYSFFLMWMICLPILLRVEYILDLWLKNVPEYASQFVCLILVYSCVNVLTYPIWSGIQAVGRLKCFILVGSVIYLTAFPISYIFLKLGYGPMVVFQVLIVVRAIYHFVVMGFLMRYASFSYWRYAIEVMYPILKVCVLSLVVMCLVNQCFSQNFLSLVLVCIICLMVTISIICILGLTEKEKHYITERIKSMIV